MSCPRERALALYVEDDLPAGEVAELQGHVTDCAACRSFLLALEASQRALKELAAEPVEEEALAVLRSRAESLPSVDGRSVRLRWAFAAAAGLALLPGLYLAIQGRPKPTLPVATQARAAVPTLRPAEAPRPPVAAAVPVAAPLLSRAERRGSPRPTQNAELSPQDMDQLARALVAVSKVDRVRSLPQVEIDPDPTEQIPVSGPMVQVATDDPNVVIYWRLERNGGK